MKFMTKTFLSAAILRKKPEQGWFGDQGVSGQSCPKGILSYADGQS